ncbi:MAG TPA: hypothetical protein PLA25_02710 [Anaerolineaceae bacterium]|nr:hypothetical protein [Anaerolineaceae bacterium]
MEKSERIKVWVGAAALLWVVAVVLMYYVSHKPITPEIVLNLGRLAWRLVVAASIITLGGALGSLLLPGKTLPPLTRAALQAGLGVGLLALVMLMVGALVGVHTLMGLAVFALLGIFFRRARAWLANWRALGDLWHASDGFGRWVGGLCAALLALALVVALAPPLWFDSLSTHLLLPQAYLDNGRVAYLPWQVMSGMPQNAEMIYLLAMLLGGGPAATTVGWAFGLLALAGWLGYLADRLGPRPAWVGLAALTAGYSMVMLTAAGYVDWLALWFGLGVLVLLDDWRQNGGGHTLALAGVFAGLAVGAKYTAGVIALAGLGALAWHTWKRRDAFIPRALTFGLWALAAALPWFVKNGLTTGNPIYPFFFGGGAMTDLRMAVWQNVPVYGNWLDILFLPVRATYLGLEGAGGYMVALGPLLLGLGALAWLGRGRRTAAQTASLENAAWIAVLGLLIWTLGNQYSGRLIQTRYYFALFPAFAALAGFGFWGISRLNLSQVRLGRVVSAFVLLALVLNLIEVSTQVIRQDALRAALGLRSEADYVADNLGWYQRAMWGIQALPEDARVLLLYEARGYYCAPTCIADEVLDRWKGDRDTYQTTAGILQAWQEQGITHVLAYTTGMNFLKTAGDPNHPPEDIAALEALLAELPPPVDYGGTYALYPLP